MLAEKWEKHYSEVCGYANALMSGIAIVRATQCLFPKSEYLTNQYYVPITISPESIKKCSDIAS
jgi:hypothetical protein